MRIATTTETAAGMTIVSDLRRTWAAPSLRLLPIEESKGSTFSLASVDGTSSS